MRTTLCNLACGLLACGLLAGCHGPVAHNLPPAERLMHPGPGVGGPGPGVIPASYVGGGNACGPAFTPTSQVAFVGSNGMQIRWDVSGQGLFDAQPLVVPGRQNFPQGAIYRLKLTNLPGRPGVELYPTLEVGPATPRTDAYLSHAPIPVQITEEDFAQVLSGNYVTKVIYLPDPEFQELALARVDTLVSTRLDPGVDPIEEADRRGSILAILRVGNKDLELPGDPSMGSEGILPAGYQGDVFPAGYGPVGGNMGGGYGMSGGPMGVPTAGFAPPVAPPGVVSGVNGPQYGMPFVGTPIGLPGPPHIPLGAPAGLTRHVIKNKTRVDIPPPVSTMHVSVKQRPGMNYPPPVRNVHISEVNRAPLNLRAPAINFNGGSGGAICTDGN